MALLEREPLALLELAPPLLPLVTALTAPPGHIRVTGRRSATDGSGCGELERLVAHIGGFIRIDREHHACLAVSNLCAESPERLSVIDGNGELRRSLDYVVESQLTVGGLAEFPVMNPESIPDTVHGAAKLDCEML